MGKRTPEIAVVVPSHERPLRLRWLLNGLEEQRLEPSRFEVVVCHDSSGPETEELLRSHPLARAGVLRHVKEGPCGPARKRNTGWRATTAPLVAFTDDDCRPPPDWLERALAAARRLPDAIVQGTTLPDPEEDPIWRQAPWTATLVVRPPHPSAQTCNIVYPREVLERIGGFDETLHTGEDTDLAERARAVGVSFEAAPEVLTWHAVQELSLVGMVGVGWRWRHIPELIKRHPQLRRDYPLRAFFSGAHPWLLLALAAWPLGRRRLVWTLIALPYLIHRVPRYGPRPRARLRALLDLPVLFAADALEVGGLAWGSVKHRSLFL